MSTETFPELRVLRVPLAPETRDRHLVELTRAIRSAPARRGATWIGWRRWMASAAAAGALLTPAVAVAADGALPGDVLYPIKRLLEPVVRLIDAHVVAEHRVEELEMLIDRDPSARIVADLLVDAQTAVDAVDVPDLTERLRVIESVIDRHLTDRASDAEDDPFADVPPLDTTVTTAGPTDRVHVTDTDEPAPTTDDGRRDVVPPPAEAPSASDATTATTSVPRERDATQRRDRAGDTAPAHDEAAPVTDPIVDQPAHDANHEGSRESDAPSVRVDGDHSP